MEPFYIFLIRNDVWIYIVSALGLFWYTSEFFRARRMLRRAIFGLEQETGRRIRNNALGFMLLFTLIISGVYYVNRQIAPQIPQELFRPPTPTPNIFITPLSSPTSLGISPLDRSSPTAPLVPTITLASQPGEIPESFSGESPDSTSQPVASPPLVTAEATITPYVGCTLDLNISEPRDGAFVTGGISLSGTASFADFLYYTLEANGPETGGQWASLLGRTVNQPVSEGFLGNVNLSQWQSGPYLIRMTGVNSAGSTVGYCVIQVTLDSN
jgi:hypothetical protein